MYTENGVMQAATVIAKTTQTLIGNEIDCGKFERLTVYFTYTKGDETGLLMKPYFLTGPVLNVAGNGTKVQVRDWSGSAGVYTANADSITLTATTTGYMTFDVSGVAFFRLEAAGSNNDGTPTGTLQAWYTGKEG